MMMIKAAFIFPKHFYTDLRGFNEKNYRFLDRKQSLPGFRIDRFRNTSPTTGSLAQDRKSRRGRRNLIEQKRRVAWIIRNIRQNMHGEPVYSRIWFMEGEECAKGNLSRRKNRSDR
ncbi:hypothetical protein GWI33_002695 [Rhynchophorus ferrugineus]|uniref:Uncharacterized protein n=1 Tax=Rhynchophorus ferrugineus TaxID=354439 RepID=A0A834HKE9_RHYFE|nr:hypothetical protein GWI33_002695 [Rhynchophorus ferrugineus]